MTAILLLLASSAMAAASPSTIAAAADRARFSLWEGAAAPIALDAAGLERDAAFAARAYDGGAQDEDLKDAIGGNALPDAAKHGSLPLARAPGLFVSVQLSLDPALGPLQDALSDLGRSAGFRPDPRFEPLFLGEKGDRAAVWGWVAPSRVGDALRVRGVQRVEISRPGLRPLDEPARGRFVVGIRLRAKDETPAPQVFARVTRDLAERADFRWRRTVGYQTVPGSDDMALVIVGDAPVRSLGEMLAHSDVVKIRPLADSQIPKAKPEPPAEAQPSARGFLEYVSANAPLLLSFTVLIAFLTLRRRRARAG